MGVLVGQSHYAHKHTLQCQGWMNHIFIHLRCQLTIFIGISVVLGFLNRSCIEFISLLIVVVCFTQMTALGRLSSTPQKQN